MTERDALLRAIAANPADDLPRLVYADWLDEHDEPERAEFIRVQCRLAEIKNGPLLQASTIRKQLGEGIDLQKRERELLHDHLELLLPDRPGLSRISDVRDRDTGETHHAGWTNTNGVGGVFLTVDFRRGFVAEVRGPLAAMLDALPGLGAELWAVTTATPTDVEPYRVHYPPDAPFWRWWAFENEGECPDEYRAALLPVDVYEELRTKHPFRTKSDARAALSHATLTLARREAGLETKPKPDPKSEIQSRFISG